MTEKKARFLPHEPKEAMSLEDRIKYSLRELAMQAHDLADRFSLHGGTPMTQEDMQVGRIAILNEVKALQAKANSEFLAGMHPDYIHDTLAEAEELMAIFNRG